MPAPGAGIGTAGREGIGMDPLEDSPRGEFPWTAMKREGVGMDPLEDPPRGEFSWTAMSSSAAMIPKGSEPSTENIRSLHHARRGGRRGERKRRERAGDLR